MYLDAWEVLRSHPVALLAPGVVLFVAFGIPAAVLQELDSADVGHVLLVAAAQIFGFTSSYLYYGYCEEITEQSRRGGGVSIRRGLADTWSVLPALILGSVIASTLTVIGFLLLIGPGVWLTLRWAVVVPAISFERAGPLRCLGRSNQLVRGRARFVLATAAAAILVEHLLTDAVEHFAVAYSSNDTLARIVGVAAGELFAGPFAGVVIAIVYFRLREADKQAQ